MKRKFYQLLLIVVTAAAFTSCMRPYYGYRPYGHERRHHDYRYRTYGHGGY